MAWMIVDDAVDALAGAGRKGGGIVGRVDRQFSLSIEVSCSPCLSAVLLGVVSALAGSTATAKQQSSSMVRKKGSRIDRIWRIPQPLWRGGAATELMVVRSRSPTECLNCQ